ncbi:uncharacterized protein LOC144341285 [Macaca mulatta]
MSKPGHPHRNQAASQAVNNRVSIFTPPQAPRLCGTSAPEEASPRPDPEAWRSDGAEACATRHSLRPGALGLFGAAVPGFPSIIALSPHPRSSPVPCQSPPRPRDQSPAASPQSESGGLRAASVRTPIRARARTRPPPRPSTNRFFPTPTTLERSPSRSPRASRKGSACAHSPARLPASRSVEKGSEQKRLRRAGGGGDGDLGGGGGYDGDGCARSLSRRHGGCRGQISGGSGSARARRRQRRLVTSSSCCPRRWCFNNELLAPLRRGSRVGAAGQGFPFPSASVPFPLPRTDSSLPGDAGALGPWRRRSRAWARGRPSTGVGSLRPAKPAGE